MTTTGWRSTLKRRTLVAASILAVWAAGIEARLVHLQVLRRGDLAARAEEVSRLLAAGKPTIPATIGAEKAANPFLRADVPEVAQSVGLSGSPAWKVFAEIRERKNRF